MDTQNLNYYWETVHKMLDCIGHYMQAVQLRDNLRDPETAWKVQQVLTTYYCGNIDKVSAKISYERDGFYNYVDKLNRFCKRNGVQHIVRPRKLFELLCNSKRRNFYRQRANRCLEKGNIIALQDIERDFLAKRRPHS